MIYGDMMAMRKGCNEWNSMLVYGDWGYKWDITNQLMGYD